MTLLTIVQQACKEMALQSPNTVSGAQDQQTIQMHALLNRLGADLCRQYDWQKLDNEFIINTQSVTIPATTVQGSTTITVADTTGLSSRWGVNSINVSPFTQIISIDSPTTLTINMPALSSGTEDTVIAQVEYPLPSDWKKQIPQTEWDRTNRWPLMGPQSPQAWQSFKSGIVYAGPRERFRILGSSIAINPPPPAGLTFSMEYISSSYVVGSDGTRKNQFTADDDQSLLDMSLMVSGLKAKFKQAKGLDVGFELSEFNSILDQCKAQDRSAPKLSLSPWGATVLLGTDNIADGNWGHPTW